MTKKKKLDWPILSLLHPRLVISPPIKIRRETEIIVKVFDQVVGIEEPLPLVSMLPKLKNKTNNPKNNKTLARSSTITIKRWVTILISILNKSPKTSFIFDNFFVDDFGQYKSCFLQ